MNNNKQQLEALYLRAKTTYYKGSPIMSDAEFDVLEDKLKKLNSTVINQVGSQKGGKFKHITPMKSLDKISVFDNDDLPLADVKKFLDTAPKGTVFEITAKFDGNAKKSIYNNKGQLLRALTRGNGEEGHDKTKQAECYIPTSIDLSHMGKIDFKTIEVSGETVVPTDLFDNDYQPNWKKWGLDSEPMNARNFVAGQLGRDTMNSTIMKTMAFMAFEAKLNYADGTNRRVGKVFDWFEKTGFNSEYEVKRWYISDVSEFEKVYKQLLAYREKYSPIQLDGFVIKAPVSLRDKLGEKDHHPSWAMAIKFPPEAAITTLNEIEGSMRGCLGEIIPVAVMTPVNLDGAMVKRANLHHWGNVEALGLDLGCSVQIAKAGDIIPQVYKLTKSTGTIYQRPSSCPTCNHATESKGIHLYCTNNVCPSKLIGKLVSSIEVLGRKGIGPSAIKGFYKAGFKTIDSLFLSDQDELKRKLVASGEFKYGRSLDIVVNALYQKKSYPLAKIVEASTFENVGKTASKQMAKYLSGVSYNTKQLNKDAIAPFFDENSEERLFVKRFIAQLKGAGIGVINETARGSGIKVYEMTNSPKDAGFSTKEEFIEFMEPFGYEHGKLDKEASYLVTESLTKDSGKMQKAKKLGVEIITYGDLAAKHGWKGSTSKKSSSNVTAAGPKQVSLF